MRLWWVVLCLAGCLGIDPFDHRVELAEDATGIALDARRYLVHVSAQNGLIDQISIGDGEQLLSDTPPAPLTGVKLTNDTFDASQQLATTVSKVLVAGPVIVRVESETVLTGGYSALTRISAFPDGRMVRNDRIKSTSGSQQTLTSYIATTLNQPEFRPPEIVSDQAEKLAVACIAGDPALLGVAWRATGTGEATFAIDNGTPSGTFTAPGGMDCSDVDPCNSQLTTTLQLIGPEFVEPNPNDPSETNCTNVVGLLKPELEDLAAQKFIELTAPSGRREARLDVDGVYSVPNVTFGIEPIEVAPPNPAGFPKGFVLELQIPNATAIEIISNEAREILIQREPGTDRVFIWTGQKIQGVFTVVPS